MARYALHDLKLDVDGPGPETGAELDRVLQDLSWDRTEASPEEADFSLSVLLGEQASPFPAEAREVLRAGGFQGFECDDEFYLTDGATQLRLELRTSARRSAARAVIR